jgi:hypothetical protein
MRLIFLNSFGVNILFIVEPFITILLEVLFWLIIRVMPLHGGVFLDYETTKKYL